MNTDRTSMAMPGGLSPHLLSPGAMDLDSPSYAVQVKLLNGGEQSGHLDRTTGVLEPFIFSSTASGSPKVTLDAREKFHAQRSLGADKKLSPAGRLARQTQQQEPSLQSRTKFNRKGRRAPQEFRRETPGRIIPMHIVTIAGWLAMGVWSIVTALYRMVNRRLHDNYARVYAITTPSGKRRCVSHHDLFCTDRQVTSINTAEELVPMDDRSQAYCVRFEAQSALQAEIDNKELEKAMREHWKHKARSVALGKSGNNKRLGSQSSSKSSRHRISSPLSSSKQQCLEEFKRRAQHRQRKDPRFRQLRIAWPSQLETIAEASHEPSPPSKILAYEDALLKAKLEAFDAKNQAGAQREKEEKAAILQRAIDLVSNDERPAPNINASTSRELATNTQQVNRFRKRNARNVITATPKELEATMSKSYTTRWLGHLVEKNSTDEVIKDENIDLLTKKARALIIKTDEEHKAQRDHVARVEQIKHATAAWKADRQRESDARVAEREARAAEIQKKALEQKVARQIARELKRKEALERERAYLLEAQRKVRELEDAANAKRVAEEAERRARASQIFSGGRLIVLPSEAMSQKLDDKMTARSNTVVATTVTNTTIERDDLARVLGTGSGTRAPAWLNDVSVNAWMQILCAAINEDRGWRKERGGPCPPLAAYSSAWLKQVQDKGAASLKRWTSRLGITDGRLDEVDMVFLPVNTGAHWTMIIIRGKDRTIEYLDSLGGSGSSALSAARQLLQAELGSAYSADDWTMQDSRSLRQSNSDDCGVFACFNAFAAARGINYNQVSAAKMPVARRLMAAVLINGGFTGDAKL